MQAVLNDSNQSETPVEKQPKNELELWGEQIEALEGHLDTLNTVPGSLAEKLSLSIQKLILGFKLSTKYKFKPWLKNLTYKYLSDDTMILLAIGMIPAIVLPYFFDFQPMILLIFDCINYFVLLVFLVEFLSKLYVANSWRDFFVNDKWHVLDFGILLIAGLEFVPFASIAGTTAAPLLRLLRVSRALAVAGRTAARSKSKNLVISTRELKASIFDGELQQNCDSLRCFNELVRNPRQEWIDIQNINADYIRELSTMIAIPEYELRNKVVNEASPGIDYSKNFTIIFIKDLKLVPFDEKVQRIKTSYKSLAIVFAGSSIITLSTSENDLFKRLVESKKDLKVLDNSNFNIQILHNLLEMKIKDYQEIVNLVDKSVENIELEGEMNPGRSREIYLKDTFLLKKEINNAYYSLKRMQYILENITGDHGKDILKGISNKNIRNFKDLLNDCRDIKANTENIRDNLISLIDWHMNATSFQMNKVMKVLTLITCLAIVPTIVTGFLGENIMGSTGPFDITLFEVFILVSYIMVWSGLYAYIKGWLS